MAKFAFVLALLAIGADICLVSCEFTQILKLKNGKVRGVLQDVDNGKKVEFYEGIRYGHAGRFEKPKPTEPWTEVYDATSMRGACPQFGSLEGANQWMLNVTKTFSEDCLFVNVWRPTEQKANRSVMVWIHGGAFEIGTIFTSIFDSRYIADQGDVIIVSINYRLGPLGFVNGANVPPNLGLHDQILALKWVNENIHFFGGNPTKITIFGESAGAISVGALILSPLTKGLFKRAIMQSGAPTAEFVTESLAKSKEKTQILAKKLHCPVDAKLDATIQCLHNKTVKELQDASVNDFPRNEFFVPVYGDEVLPLKPSTALKTGKFHPIDFLYGVNRDEGANFAPLFVPDVARTDINLTVQLIKDDIAKLMTFYGQPLAGKEVADFYTNKLHNPTQDDLKAAVSNAWGDMNLVCPTIIFGEEFAKHSTTSHIYSYRLMQPITIPGLSISKLVPHGVDQVYLFMSQLAKLSAPLYQLSQDMIHAWTAFAKTGKPSKMGGSVQWEEAFDRTNKDFSNRYMHLESLHYKMVPGYFKQICDSFWKAKIFE